MQTYEEMLAAADFTGKGTPKVIRPRDSGFVELAKVLYLDFPEIKDANVIERIRKRRKLKLQGEEAVTWKPEVIEVAPPPVSSELKSAGPTLSEKSMRPIPLPVPNARERCGSSASSTNRML